MLSAAEEGALGGCRISGVRYLEGRAVTTVHVLEVVEGFSARWAAV